MGQGSPPRTPPDRPPGSGPPQQVWSVVELATMQRWYRGGGKKLDVSWAARDIRRDALSQRMLNDGMLLSSKTSGKIDVYPTDRMRSLMWTELSISA